MKKDVFYVVTVPRHTQEEMRFGRPPCRKLQGGLFGNYVDVPPEPPTYKTVFVPEKKYYFDKRKKAKRFCLEYNYPMYYITEEVC